MLYYTNLCNATKIHVILQKFIQYYKNSCITTWHPYSIIFYMRLIVIKLYTMYNFLKIKNNSKLLHIYFPLFLVEHSARVSRFLKHIKVNLRKKKNPHTNLVLKYLINALKEKKTIFPLMG